MAQTKKQNKLRETILEGAWILELLEKAFKTTFLKMYKELREDNDKEKKMMEEQKEILIMRKKLFLKRIKKKFQRIKITITIMKSSPQGFKTRHEQAKASANLKKGYLKLSSSRKKNE